MQVLTPVEVVSAAELVRLGEARGGTRVSLFLPTPRRGADARAADRIRVKNLLRRTERALLARGSTAAEVDGVVGDLRAFLSDPWLPSAPHRGLAVFADHRGVRPLRTSAPLPELTVLGPSFAIGPLLPLLHSARPFHVLAVGNEEISLLRGSRFGIEPLDVSGQELGAWLTMPRTGSEVHAFLAARGGGRKQPMFHGIPSERADRERILQHFRGVDQAIRTLVEEGDAPLLLAGLPHLQALYREVNTYAGLQERGIDGNPHDLESRTLHRAAMAIVEPVLLSDQARAVSRYAALLGTGRTAAADPREVVDAADHGRVDLLLVAAERLTGGARGAHGRLVVRSPGRPDVAEQLEIAATATLRHGGEVYVVPAAEVPGSTAMGAVLRY